MVEKSEAQRIGEEITALIEAGKLKIEDVRQLIASRITAITDETGESKFLPPPPGKKKLPDHVVEKLNGLPKEILLTWGSFDRRDVNQKGPASVFGKIEGEWDDYGQFHTRKFILNTNQLPYDAIEKVLTSLGLMEAVRQKMGSRYLSHFDLQCDYGNDPKDWAIIHPPFFSDVTPISQRSGDHFEIDLIPKKPLDIDTFEFTEGKMTIRAHGQKG